MPTDSSKVELKFLKNLKNEVCVINLRSNRKVFGIVKAVDNHFNVILSDAVEIRQSSKLNKESNETEIKNYERKLKCLFIRGDSVISVSKNNPAISES